MTKPRNLPPLMIRTSHLCGFHNIITTSCSTMKVIQIKLTLTSEKMFIGMTNNCFSDLNSFQILNTYEYIWNCDKIEMCTSVMIMRGSSCVE